MNLLGLLSGSGPQDVNKSAGRQVISHINRLTAPWIRPSTVELLSADFHPEEDSFQRSLRLFHQVMLIFRDNCQSSIDSVIQKLSDGPINAFVVIERQDHRRSSLAKQVIFHTVAIMTQLLVPQWSLGENLFRVDCQGAPCPARTIADIGKSNRPIDEILRAFGETLPRKMDVTTADLSSPRFQVSSLNARTLRRIGNIQIKWVDSLSSHLCFDATVPALYLYRSPSFCDLYKSEDSILSRSVIFYYVLSTNWSEPTE